MNTSITNKIVRIFTEHHLVSFSVDSGENNISLYIQDADTDLEIVCLDMDNHDGEVLRDFLIYALPKEVKKEPVAKGTSILATDISGRTASVLREDGIITIEAAQALTDYELLRMPNMGRKGIAEIRNWIPKEAQHG